MRVRSFLEAQNGQKKILFERLFSRDKKMLFKTEVKENQYLTASGIKFFQKQTAGNNCPVCMAELTGLWVASSLSALCSSCHSCAVGGQLRAERAL